jgi:hypothetical protein
MFPVTRQVRRKRTPVFGRPGRMRGSADESEESGGACAQRRARARSRAGSVRERRGLEREARARRRSQAGPGERKAGLGETMRSPDKQTHRWPPDGQAADPRLGRLFSPGGPIPPAPLGEKDPRPPGNQRCDLAGPAAVAEMPGPIRWNTAPSWSPHNPRTPACAY